MLNGNLRTMGLPEILQWIAIGRKTGTLVLQNGSVQKRILFDAGNIYSSWSNDPRESLGQFLVRGRKISEEQLFKALLRQEELGRMLGGILVDEGALSEDELRATLRLKAEETIYDLFLWPEAHFEFKDGDVPRDVPVNLDLQVQSVVLEGMRRVDEWARIRQAFPTQRTRFRVVSSGVAAVTEPAEREALRLIAAGKTLSEVALEMRRSPFEAAALVFELFSRRLVEVESFEEEPRAVDPIETVRDLLASAHQHGQARRFDAAQRDYEAVLALDRLNQHAKKGLIGLMEARRRDRVVRSVRLDMVPHLAQDLLALTKQNFDPQEGFVLSRVNGEWDVQSILKLCPMGEQETLEIFARLLDRSAIELRER